MQRLLQQMVQCESSTAEWERLAAVSWISRVLEYNEDISEHVGLPIKLVSGIIHNDKEDPLTSVSAPTLHTPVPEADGCMWRQFTHEQGGEEKTIFPPLLCSGYPLTKHFSMILQWSWYVRFLQSWEYPVAPCLSTSACQHNPEAEYLCASPDSGA